MLNRAAAVWIIAFVASCAGTRVNGAGVLLDMQPSRPTFVGAYDFDLLDHVRGSACMSATKAAFEESVVYWLAGDGFDHLPSASRNAIGAAVFQILDEHPGFDSIVATRVIVTAKDTDTSCATVYGRGIRLKKASPPPPPTAIPPPSAEPQRTDEEDDDREGSPEKTDDPFSKLHR